MAFRRSRVGEDLRRARGFEDQLAGAGARVITRKLWTSGRRAATATIPGPVRVDAARFLALTKSVRMAAEAASSRGRCEQYEAIEGSDTLQM